MIRDSMYENRGRQEDRRKKREEEKQKRALKNALAAGRSAYDPGDSLCLEQDEIIANVNEWQRKAELAAAKAEQYAQNALTAESRGDMGAAAFLWGDSRKSDLKAKNYSKEALRYESMLQPPDTAPEPMSVKPAVAGKPATPPPAPPGAVTQGELAAGQEKAVWAVPDKGGQESAPASIHAGRIALEQDLNRLRSELQMYSELSGGKGEPWILGWYADQIHDVMKAMEALPAEPVREDILLQALKGNYYTGQPTPEGAAAQMALGMSGLDFLMDIRDLSYDVTHLKTVPAGQLAIDAAALLPFVGGLKYLDEAGVLLKQGQNAAEALTDAAKHGDDLVDAGGELVYNGAKQLDNIELMPADLMEELAQSGVKYTPEDVLMVTKNSDGDLLWLETGNEDAGLTHILRRHEGDFERRGIGTEGLPNLLNEILVTSPDSIKQTKRGYEAVYTYEGMQYKVAYGTNGFVVSFYPIRKK